MEYTKLTLYGKSPKHNYLMIVKETYKTITLAEYMFSTSENDYVKVGQKRFKISDFNDAIDCGLLQYVLED